MTSRIAAKSFRAAIAFVAIVLVSAVPAFAAPELAFDQGLDDDAGGFIYWTGDPTDGLIGLKISFFNIKATDTPLNSTRPNLVCLSCLLNFETGAFNGGLGPFDTFKGGGSFALTGGVSPDPGGAPPFGGLGFESSILSGEFTNNPGQVINVTRGGTVTGRGFDVKHEDLTAYYGLGTDFRFTETTILSTRVHSGVGTIDLHTFDPVKFALGEVVINFEEDGYLFRVSNADIFNSPLPVPGSAALFVLGLAGLIAVRRRKN